MLPLPGVFLQQWGQLQLDPSDAGLGRPVLLALAAGLTACGRVMVHSSTAASWCPPPLRAWRWALGRLCGSCRAAGQSPGPPDSDRRDGAAIGIYNHWLYAHYGTGQFVDLAHELRASDTMRLRGTDLFGRRRNARTSLDDSLERTRDQLAALPYVQVMSDRGDRIRYKSLIAGAASASPRSAPAAPGPCR